MAALPAMPVASSTPNVKAQSGTRANLADIDAMRGIAALVVAAIHTREITWIGIRSFWQLYGLSTAPNAIIGYLTFPLVWGAIGVPIFFVISGYCIHRSQAFARARDGTFKLSTANFLLRRFFRIYPVLFGALLLTLLCDWLSCHYFPSSSKLGDNGVSAFFVNLFSLQGIVAPPYGSNGALWTLSIEVQFYALYPLLLLMMARFGNLTTFGILGVANITSYFVLERYGYQLFLSYYISWYLGVLVAEAEANGLLSDRLSSVWLRTALYSFSFVVLCAGCALMFVSAYAAFQVWAAAFSVFLFVILKHPRKSRGRLARILQWLGTFSFSIYIIHVPIVVLIHSIFFNSVHQVSIAPLFATLATVIGCAYLFSLVFEKPALALSQTFGGHRRLATSIKSQT